MFCFLLHVHPTPLLDRASCSIETKRIDQGHPIRYNQLTVFEDIIAKHKSIRFEVESVSGDGHIWRRQNSSVDIEEDTLDDQLRERIASGAQSLRADAFVKVLFVSCFIRVGCPPTPPTRDRTRDR